MRQPKDAPPTARGVAHAFFNLALAVLFYPIGFGLIFYLLWKGYHWGWSALIIAALLIFDPFWRMLFGNMFRRR